MSMRPNDSSASAEKAEGEKSRSLSAQPVHLSVILTVTLLPWSEDKVKT
jgi:hypothetical protein